MSMDAANLVRLAQQTVDYAKTCHEDSLKLLQECSEILRDFKRLQKACGAPKVQLESDQATLCLIDRDRGDASNWVWRAASRLEVARKNLLRAEERQRNEETAVAKAREAATPPAHKTRCRNRRLTEMRKARLAYTSPVLFEFPDGSTVLAPSPREQRAMRKARRECRLRTRRPRRKSKAKASPAVASRVCSDTQSQRASDGVRRNVFCQSEQSRMAAILTRASRRATLAATTDFQAPKSAVSGRRTCLQADYDDSLV